MDELFTMHEHLIVKLQAHWRGFLCRKEMKDKGFKVKSGSPAKEQTKHAKKVSIKDLNASSKILSHEYF
jgi:hypothetical protein